MYRERRRACPACAQSMEPIPLDDPSAVGGHVEIDRCEGCGGSFFEFFDGEPIRLAGESMLAAPPREGAPEGPRRAPVCPDCGTEMERRPYLEEGPPLARCEACMALFVAADELDRLSKLRLDPLEDEPSWLDRLLRWLTGRRD